MDDAERMDFYYDFLKQQHEVVQRKLDSLLRSLASDDGEAKKAAVKDLTAALGGLSNALPANHYPDWLSKLATALSRFENNAGSKRRQGDLLMEIVPLIVTARQENWAPRGKGVRVDFDSIFEQYRSSSEIPRLLDRIVELIEKMVSSNAIDSRRVIQTLEGLIATIKVSKTGSYLSLMCSWNFLSSLVRKVAWEMVGDITVIGPIAKGLKEAIDELGTEVDNMNRELRRRVQESAEAELPLLAGGEGPQLSPPHYLLEIRGSDGYES